MLVQCEPPHPKIFLRMSAEHGELCGAALQSMGSVVRQHAADWSVRAQWMAGAELRRVRADLGSAGLQVSTRLKKQLQKVEMKLSVFLSDMQILHSQILFLRRSFLSRSTCFSQNRSSLNHHSRRVNYLSDFTSILKLL